MYVCIISPSTALEPVRGKDISSIYKYVDSSRATVLRVAGHHLGACIDQLYGVRVLRMAYVIQVASLLLRVVHSSTCT
jgi:hypothetical protein